MNDGASLVSRGGEKGDRGEKGDIAQIDNRKISEPTFDSCR